MILVEGEKRRKMTDNADSLDNRHIAEALLVTSRHPAALADHRGGLLINLGLGRGNLIHSELIEWPGGLDVLEGLLKAAELGLNLALGLLSALNSLGLESLDSLQLTGNIVGGGLEGLELVLDLVDNGLVLQDLAVVGEVDGLGLFGQKLNLATGIVVPLLESLERGSGLAAEAERAGHLDPVNLKSGAAGGHFEV